MSYKELVEAAKKLKEPSDDESICRIIQSRAKSFAFDLKSIDDTLSAEIEITNSYTDDNGYCYFGNGELFVVVINDNFIICDHAKVLLFSTEENGDNPYKQYEKGVVITLDDLKTSERLLAKLNSENFDVTPVQLNLHFKLKNGVNRKSYLDRTLSACNSPTMAIRIETNGILSTWQITTTSVAFNSSKLKITGHLVGSEKSNITLVCKKSSFDLLWKRIILPKMERIEYRLERRGIVDYQKLVTKRVNCREHSFLEEHQYDLINISFNSF